MDIAGVSGSANNNGTYRLDVSTCKTYETIVLSGVATQQYMHLA